MYSTLFSPTRPLSVLLQRRENITCEYTIGIAGRAIAAYPVPREPTSRFRGDLGGAAHAAHALCVHLCAFLTRFTSCVLSFDVFVFLVSISSFSLRLSLAGCRRQLFFFLFRICTRVHVRAPFCLRWCCSLKNWFRRFEVSFSRPLGGRRAAQSAARAPAGVATAREAAKQKKGHGKERGGGGREIGASR